MATRPLSRRDFLRSGIVTVGAVTFGSGLLRSVLAAPIVNPGPSPYGPLQEFGDTGIFIPAGFTVREIARAGAPVLRADGLPTPYIWHTFPDGGAVFPHSSGDGWTYVSNSEVPFGGGVGAIRFDGNGNVVDAYRLLAGTSQNCSGGPTPWGTWLTCEEHPWGLVWEVHPEGLPLPGAPGGLVDQGISYPAMGRFQHEAAAVDLDGGAVYLTEDQADSLFYRFLPDDTSSLPWDLSVGTLQAASVASDGSVSWVDVPHPDPVFPAEAETRKQFGPGQVTAFDGGEGTWIDGRVVYFTTKGDHRVWAYDAAASSLDVLYEPKPGLPLNGVDNVMVSEAHEVFVAEDHTQLPKEIVLLTTVDDPDTAGDERVVTPVIQVTGDPHAASELAGPALWFDEDDVGHFYFSSQRGYGQGVTYEVAGPFNRAL